MDPLITSLTALPFIGIFIALVIWSVAWKGWALWLAAKNTHKWWFVILLLVNTAGILDIIYIFAVGKSQLNGSGTVSSSPAA